MDYGELIERSWRLAWRHRLLWVLGLFVPGAGGSCSFNGGERLFEQVPPAESPETIPSGFERTFAQIGRWIEQNSGLAIGLALVLGLLALLSIALWFVAQGGMARATTALARRQPVTAGVAWAAGLHLFWRYVGLFLIQLGMTLVVVLAAAALIAAIVFLGAVTSDSVRLLMIISSILLGLALLVSAGAFLVLLSIAVVFAQRALVVDDLGPVAGLRAGAALVRTHLNDSVVIWLINLALSIGVAIAVTVAVLIVLLPFGAFGFALFVTEGASQTALLYTAAAAVVAFAIAWLLSAVANAFAWTYWTLAYLALTGRLTAEMEPVPPAALA